VNKVSVFEGDPVTLNPDTEIQSDDHIEWRFGNEVLITETRRGGDISINRGIAGWRFRDRLELNRKTGSLTIKHTEMRHAGVYQLQITSNKEVSYETFIVDLRSEYLSLVSVIMITVLACNYYYQLHLRLSLFNTFYIKVSNSPIELKASYQCFQ